MTAVYKYASPLGEITIAGSDKGVTGLWLEGQKYFAETLPGDCAEEMLPVFKQTKEWLDVYFSGREPDFLPPLQPEGSPFRKAVWKILLEIPYGQTMTYGEIAERMARQMGKTSMSAQAVGGAVGLLIMLQAFVRKR